MSGFRLLYDLAIHCYALLMLPKVFYEWITHGKHRSNFFTKLGIGFPKVEKKNIIWVHAVSVGETKAIAPLVKRLQKNGAHILLSTTTETGYAEGKRVMPNVDYHVYLPFDLSYVIRPIVKKVAPSLLILTETDFWYHFQSEAKKQGARIVVANGKLSARSFNRYRKFPRIARHLLGSIDHFCVQNNLYQERFEQLGVSPAQITVTGNLKLDGKSEVPDLYEALDIARDANIITLGSTHDPEERVWLQSLKHLWKTFPHLKVLLVPRHPERFEKVAKMIQEENIPFTRWSDNPSFKKTNLILMDTMGLLQACYRVSSIAFVGGSLTPNVGGHNIIEPARYATPVLYGPHMHSQPGFVDLIRRHGGGIEITQETLLPTLKHLLHSPQECLEMGEQGLKLILASRGALRNTYKVVVSEQKRGCEK